VFHWLFSENYDSFRLKRKHQKMSTFLELGKPTRPSHKVRVTLMKRISKKTKSETHPPPAEPDPAHPEILRIIGNASAADNVCVMARGRYGLSEFGRLFYLLAGVSNQKLGEYLDQIDAARSGHCIKCSLKILAFCRFYCGDRMEQRLGKFIREYELELELFDLERDSERDFLDEVGYAIECAKPQTPATPAPESKGVKMWQRVFPTDIRLFRGDFDE